ncbi:MAG TPA: phosphoribosylglycinamide formyltransferase [Spirochaetota bacterium]|nr:phosphoribosylglycinamide formyltransferase [Spirochaetota bacterium]
MFPGIRRRKVISFLVSGNGMLFATVVKSISTGYIKAKIGCVVTDNQQARVIHRASALGVPCYIMDPAICNSKEEYDEKLIKIFEDFKSELIVTAGYLRLLTPLFITKYRNQIINVHPSLLPSFPGLKSQMQALEYGVIVSGCTTHFIDDGIDSGPIIMQSPVWISGSDTVDSLSAKILSEESKILSDSVRLYCEEKIKFAGRRITIIC